MVVVLVVVLVDALLELFILLGCERCPLACERLLVCELLLACGLSGEEEGLNQGKGELLVWLSNQGKDEVCDVDGSLVVFLKAVAAAPSPAMLAATTAPGELAAAAPTITAPRPTLQRVSIFIIFCSMLSKIHIDLNVVRRTRQY